MGEEKPFEDALFRQRRKKGRCRLVEPPRLEEPVVDTHAHVHLLPDPALALARAAVWGVELVCDIVDIWEDDQAVFDLLDGWRSEAAALVPQLAARSAEALCEIAEGKDARTRLPDGAAPAAFALPGDAAVRPAPRLRIAVGCHPHNAQHYDEALEARLRARLADPRVCAVGEIGLDYHYDFSPRDAQLDAFARQVRLAHRAGLPVALHVREAHDDAFRVMEREGWPAAGTLLHCYTSDAATLAPWLQAGCHVAFGGALTFSGSDDIRAAAASAPEGRLLTETDSPYMAPVPLRGERCEPAMTVFSAARLAEVRGHAPGEGRAAFLRALARNAYGFLGVEDAREEGEQ